jgi:transcriptional regulator with XRE-family HTH domain
MKAILVGESTSDDNDPGRSGRIRDANKGTGERIRLARKWAGFNQDEVATRMGLSRASVSNWELGQGIRRGNLLTFAQIVGVSAEWLMTGEPKNYLIIFAVLSARRAARSMLSHRFKGP